MNCLCEVDDSLSIESEHNYKIVFCRIHNAAYELLEACKQSKTMTNELLRTIDDDHWYAGDLTSLRVMVINAINKAEGRI